MLHDIIHDMIYEMRYMISYMRDILLLSYHISNHIISHNTQGYNYHKKTILILTADQFVFSQTDS